MRAHILLLVPVFTLLHLGCGGTDPSTSQDPGVQLPLRLSLETEVLGRGESSTGTVDLREPASEEGAVVALSASDDASLSMPTAITIAAGEFTGTFVLTNTYGGEPKPVMITATYGSASVKGAVFVPSLPPEPPICRNHACTK